MLSRKIETNIIILVIIINIMNHKQIQNFIEHPIVKHQHGHRNQIQWYDWSFKTRKHMGKFVPQHHWNKNNPTNDDIVKFIYAFKNQNKWAIHKLHNARIQKRRMIARDTKYFDMF